MWYSSQGLMHPQQVPNGPVGPVIQINLVDFEEYLPFNAPTVAVG